MKLHIFDFDGTLARPVNDDIERPHTTPDFEYAKKIMDPCRVAQDVRLPLLRAALHYQGRQNHAVWVLTGRAEWSRDITEAWLHRHFLFPVKLLMRQNGDARPAHETKQPVLLQQSQMMHDGDYEIEVVTVYDDDPLVLAYAESLGLKVVDARKANGSGNAGR